MDPLLRGDDSGLVGAKTLDPLLRGRAELRGDSNSTHLALDDRDSDPNGIRVLSLYLSIISSKRNSSPRIRQRSTSTENSSDRAAAGPSSKASDSLPRSGSRPLCRDE